MPSTNWGKIFCIFFAFIGIPLTLIVIADLGKLFAEAVVQIALTMKSRLPFRARFTCIPTNVTGRRSLGEYSIPKFLEFGYFHFHGTNGMASLQVPSPLSRYSFYISPAAPVCLCCGRTIGTSSMAFTSAS